MNSLDLRTAHMMYSPGCMLTDPVLAERFNGMYSIKNTLTSSVLID